MPVLEVKRRVKATPDIVWKVISDVGGLAEVAPHISKVEIIEGEKVGLRRRVYDRRGSSWEEECIAWDEGKSYTMRVDTSHYPFAFSKMTYTWGIRQGAKNVQIRTLYDYTPKYGPFGGILDRLRFRKGFKETCAELMDNWVRRIHNQEWLHRVTVGTILRRKGHDIISITPDTLVADTANLLRENRIGSVLALEEGGGIAGVVSERDIVRGISEFGREVLDGPVSKIMTKKVVVCHPEDNMVLVLSCMTDRRVRHLPVMDDEELVGIISIGDVVKTRMEELENESASLRNFISARQWREQFLRFGPNGADATGAFGEHERPR